MHPFLQRIFHVKLTAVSEEKIAKAEEQRRVAEEARAASEQETKRRLDEVFAQLRDVRPACCITCYVLCVFEICVC